MGTAFESVGEAVVEQTFESVVLTLSESSIGRKRKTILNRARIILMLLAREPLEKRSKSNEQRANHKTTNLSDSFGNFPGSLSKGCLQLVTI